MGLPLIVLLLIAALLHARIRYPENSGAMAEMLLVYVLVGYCGVQQNGSSPTWASSAGIFATHGLISVLLIGLYWASQEYRARRTTPVQLFSGRWNRSPTTLG